MSLTAGASFCDGALGCGVSVRQAVTVVMVGEGFEDTALGGKAFNAAGSHETGEFVPQDGQTPHLCLNLGELRDRQDMGGTSDLVGR